MQSLMDLIKNAFWMILYLWAAVSVASFLLALRSWCHFASIRAALRKEQQLDDEWAVVASDETPLAPQDDMESFNITLKCHQRAPPSLF